MSRLQSRGSARPAISIVQLRSQQPACPDFCNPETILIPLQHTGLSALFLAAAASAAQAQPTTYPLTVTNCGQPITFEAAPDSTTTIGQPATETLYAHGLGEKVIVTPVWFNPVLPELKDVDVGLGGLADQQP